MITESVGVECVDRGPALLLQSHYCRLSGTWAAHSLRPSCPWTTVFPDLRERHLCFVLSSSELLTAPREMVACAHSPSGKAVMLPGFQEDSGHSDLSLSFA